MIVHVWTAETKVRRSLKPWGDVIETRWHRLVCSCGRSTSWWRRFDRAEDDAARHACNGQLSVYV